jgi:hypothetical protein
MYNQRIIRLFSTAFILLLALVFNALAQVKENSIQEGTVSIEELTKQISENVLAHANTEKQFGGGNSISHKVERIRWDGCSLKYRLIFKTQYRLTEANEAIKIEDVTANLRDLDPASIKLMPYLEAGYRLVFNTFNEKEKIRVEEENVALATKQTFTLRAAQMPFKDRDTAIRLGAMFRQVIELCQNRRKK